MEWSRVKSKQLKVWSATAGCTAVVAMGALAVTFTDVSAADTPEPAPPGPVMTSTATTGATVVETKEQAPSTPAVVPPITTTPSTIPPTAEQH